MYLQSNVVESFIALHEGSIVGDKTQPVIELYPQEKSVAPETDLEWRAKADCSQVCVVRERHSWTEKDCALPLGSRCVDVSPRLTLNEMIAAHYEARLHIDLLEKEGVIRTNYRTIEEYWEVVQ